MPAVYWTIREKIRLNPAVSESSSADYEPIANEFVDLSAVDYHVGSAKQLPAQSGFPSHIVTRSPPHTKQIACLKD